MSISQLQSDLIGAARKCPCGNRAQYCPVISSTSTSFETAGAMIMVLEKTDLEYLHERHLQCPNNFQ
jgi:hypothetical protein